MLKLLLSVTLFLVFSPQGFAQKGSQAIPVVRVSPIYPADALEAKKEGWVTVQFEITPQGAVDNPYVIESSPAKVFDRAALEAILKFKFKPRVVDGVAVRSTATQTIEFALQNNQSHNPQLDLSSFPSNELLFELSSLKMKLKYSNTLSVIELSSGKLIW